MSEKTKHTADRFCRLILHTDKTSHPPNIKSVTLASISARKVAMQNILDDMAIQLCLADTGHQAVHSPWERGEY
jgi:hypothetical protein